MKIVLTQSEYEEVLREGVRLRHGIELKGRISIQESGNRSGPITYEISGEETKP